MSAPQVPVTGAPAAAADTTFSPPASTGRDRRTPRSRRFRRLASATAATLLAATLAPLMPMTAQANVAAIGPVDVDHKFPTWFSDGKVKLAFCIDPAQGCLAELPKPAEPISYPANFPEEAFWFNAEAAGGNLGLYEAALEGAHANGVVRNGDQMGFGRLRFRVNNLLPNREYTITHPYGVNTFTSEADPKNSARGLINETIDAGVCAASLTRPCDWAIVGEGFLGDDAATTTSTFLKQVGAEAGTLGSINTARAVEGAPTGNNFVQIDGPDAGGTGVNTLKVSQFTVQGLLFDGADGAPSTPDLAPASDSGRSTNDNVTKVVTPTLTGTVPGVSTPTSVEFLVDGVVDPALTTSTDAAGAYSVTTGTLAQGIHKLQARILDPASAAGATPTYLSSGTLSFTVDTTAPATTIVAPFPSNPSADNTPTVNFTGEAAASYECQLLPSNPDWDGTCAAPSKTYDQQVNGSYTFNVRATDAAGNVGAIATRTWRIGTTAAPGAPTIGAPTAGAASATVRWTPPADDGGSAITGYSVRAYAGTNTTASSTTSVTGATASSAVISGLTNGTSYTFDVRAINAVGTGTASAKSTAVTPAAAATTPGAPTIGAPTGGAGSATVRWTAPTSTGGSAITGYSVRAYSGTGTTVFSTTTAAANATSLVVPIATAGSYTFDVRAINAVGTGNASARSATATVTAPPATSTVPGIPTIGAVTGGAGSATVNWTAPTSNGGSAITGYSVRAYTGTGTTVFSTTTAAATATSLVVPIATAGSYTFDVRAVNAVGTGTASARSAAATVTAPPATPTAPGAPGIGTATAGNTTATVNWTAPATTGGAAITGYSVRTFSGTTLVKTTPVGAVTSTSITGLTNGTAYTFDVAATNSAGTGTFSAKSGAVTPAGAAAGTTRTVTLNPTADTMALQGTATVASGTATSLNVDSAMTTGTTNTRASSYLKFNVPALAAGETITGASLSLQTTNGTNEGPAIWKTATTWTESGLTWNAQPAHSGTTTVGNFVGTVAIGKVTTPISGITAAGDVSLQLLAESTDGIDINSKESTGTPAQLVLTIKTA
ncbi:MAG: fibronectin type III domain-containing protein [Friedmanniella sp.]